MRRLAVLLSLAVALVALAAPLSPAWAQLETGRISGTVSDPQGGVVPGVTVTAKSVNTGATRETVSDTNGAYLIANVSPDTYEVTFMLTGFKTAARRVTVSVGATAAADVKLDVGALTEAVSVIAVPEVIDTRTGEFKTTVSARQISELPTLTRNPVRPRRDRWQRQGSVARRMYARWWQAAAAPASASTVSAARARTSCSTAATTTICLRPASARKCRLMPFRNSP
jgi:hypothetical protein